MPSAHLFPLVCESQIDVVIKYVHSPLESVINGTDQL